MITNSPFWTAFLRRYRRDRTARTAAWLLLIFTLSALLAGLIAPFNPYDPLQIDVMDAETPPAWVDDGDSRFYLGTDAQGRDLLSAILYGLRTSMLIGFFAVLLQAFLGVGIGLIAGYVGGRIDSTLMELPIFNYRFRPLWWRLSHWRFFRHYSEWNTTKNWLYIC